jgi:hypothetical protein
MNKCVRINIMSVMCLARRDKTAGGWLLIKQASGLVSAMIIS